MSWASAQFGLGIALSSLGAREPGSARREQAVAVHRKTLNEWTRDSLPLAWASEKNNLGNSMTNPGEREPGITQLLDAITVFREALEERTRDRVPLDWATTWGNLGRTFTVLADRTNDLALARQALEQLIEAEEVLRDGGHQTPAAIFAANTQEAQAVIDRLS